MRRTLTIGIVLGGGLLLAGAGGMALLGQNGRREAGLARSDWGEEERVPDPETTADRKVTAERKVTMLSTRYLTNILLALAAGFVIVATQAFAPHIVAWLGFAVTGVGVLAMMGATVILRGRGIAQRTLDAIVAVLAAWTIVETLVFAGVLMLWITFGVACGMLAIAVAALTMHELSTERVVHTLEDVRTRERLEVHSD